MNIIEPNASCKNIIEPNASLLCEIQGKKWQTRAYLTIGAIFLVTIAVALVASAYFKDFPFVVKKEMWIAVLAGGVGLDLLLLGACVLFVKKSSVWVKQQEKNQGNVSKQNPSLSLVQVQVSVSPEIPDEEPLDLSVPCPEPYAQIFRKIVERFPVTSRVMGLESEYEQSADDGTVVVQISDSPVMQASSAPAVLSNQNTEARPALLAPVGAQSGQSSLPEIAQNEIPPPVVVNVNESMARELVSGLVHAVLLRVSAEGRVEVQPPASVQAQPICIIPVAVPTPMQVMALIPPVQQPRALGVDQLPPVLPTAPAPTVQPVQVVQARDTEINSKEARARPREVEVQESDLIDEAYLVQLQSNSIDPVVESIRLFIENLIRSEAAINKSDSSEALKALETAIVLMKKKIFNVEGIAKKLEEAGLRTKTELKEAIKNTLFKSLQQCALFKPEIFAEHTGSSKKLAPFLGIEGFLKVQAFKAAFQTKRGFAVAANLAVSDLSPLKGEIMESLASAIHCPAKYGLVYSEEYHTFLVKIVEKFASLHMPRLKEIIAQEYCSSPFDLERLTQRMSGFFMGVTNTIRAGLGWSELTQSSVSSSAS